VATSALVLVVALYAAVATAYLEARRRGDAPPRWARRAGPASVVAHFAGLLVLATAMDRSPFTTASQGLSFLAFALAAFYLVLEATSHVATHGGGFWFVATLLSALAVPGLIGTPPEAVDVPRDPTRTVHVGLSLLATAAVLAGGLLAIGYLEAYRRVKRGRLRAGEPGPSLTGFERLSRGASLLGVLLLVPSLGLGVASLRERPSAATVALLATTAALLSLLLVSGWIWWRRPLRGSLAAWLHLVGIALVAVTLGVVHPLAAGWGK
jgi:ABC-type uncharacterized transport system permease subunit